MKKLIALTIMISLFFQSAMSCYAAKDYYTLANEYVNTKMVNRLVYDGTVYRINNASISNGHALIPVSVLKKIGATVEYDAKTKTANVVFKNVQMSFTADSAVGTLNGKSVKLLTAPKIKNGELTVPGKNVANATGHEYFFSKYTKNVYFETVINDYKPLWKEYAEKYGNDFTFDGAVHLVDDELYIGDKKISDIKYNGKPVDQYVMKSMILWREEVSSALGVAPIDEGCRIQHFNGNIMEFQNNGYNRWRTGTKGFVGMMKLRQFTSLRVNKTVSLDKLPSGNYTIFDEVKERQIISYCKFMFGSDWTALFDFSMMVYFTPPVKGSGLGNMIEKTHYIKGYKAIVTHEGYDGHYIFFYKTDK